MHSTEFREQIYRTSSNLSSPYFTIEVAYFNDQPVANVKTLKIFNVSNSDNSINSINSDDSDNPDEINSSIFEISDYYDIEILNHISRIVNSRNVYDIYSATSKDNKDNKDKSDKLGKSNYNSNFISDLSSLISRSHKISPSRYTESVANRELVRNEGSPLIVDSIDSLTNIPIYTMVKNMRAHLCHMSYVIAKIYNTEKFHTSYLLEQLPVIPTSAKPLTSIGIESKIDEIYSILQSMKISMVKSKSPKPEDECDKLYFYTSSLIPKNESKRKQVKSNEMWIGCACGEKKNIKPYLPADAKVIYKRIVSSRTGVYEYIRARCDEYILETNYKHIKLEREKLNKFLDKIDEILPEKYGTFESIRKFEKLEKSDKNDKISDKSDKTSGGGVARNGTKK